MAPSVEMDIDLSIQMEKKKRKKSKDLSASVEHVEDSDDSKKKKKKKKNKESGSVKEGDKATLIQLVAKYLEKRNLSKTLSSFLSETQCENSWKTQTIELEDIFNQYSNQDSEKLKKHDVKIINSHVNEYSNSKLQEQELKTKNAGSLKSQASGSDGSDSSSDDSEDEVAVKKKKNNKKPEKDCYPDSKKLPKQTNSGKHGNLLQESLEVMKEEKKKRKKNPKDKDLMDSDEQKTCFDQEYRNSCKDNSKPSKAKRKQKDSENLGESLQELLEAPKEEKKKKKKKKIEDKDGHKTSAIEENRNSIKDDSKSSKTLLKQIDSGKVDESFEKEKKKKKNKNFDKCFINNDENGNSIKDNSTPSKASKESKTVLGLYEPLQESLKVAKDKKKEEEDAKGNNTGNNGKENDVEKTKKEKFNKLETSGSDGINEEPTAKNLKDSTEDTDNLLCDTTPLNKKVKTDERNISGSSNSKKNSIEPTTAKAFQRVKLEEVKFVDPRLKDNSYWAKSGAEVGYGAKAEQVLGQVRGKDFRHEKTKKKRGSYTGGMIDLQSHSIKFSYSDEE